jgi:hypothetical protein
LVEAEKGVLTFYRLAIPAEKTLFRRQPNLYDGISIGAHVYLYYEASSSQFLASLGKPVIMDPMTYVFARPFEVMATGMGNLKRSFVRLMMAYRKSVGGILDREGRPLLPTDFEAGLVESLCRDVIGLQRRLIQTVAQPTLERLMALADQKIEKRRTNLQYVCAPYFYFEATSDPWYEVSLRLAEETLRLEQKLPVSPIICFSRQALLVQREISKIVRDYKDFPIVTIWISDFEEDKVGTKFLKGLVRLVGEFAGAGVKIYNLYGGYFSALLSKIGLTGFSSSICYGDSKSVDTVATGGGFPLRYYIPHIKSKVSVLDARTYYSDNPQYLCNCNTCSSIKEKLDARGEKVGPDYVGKFFSLLNDETAKIHFMTCRNVEIQLIKQNTLQYLIGKLRSEFDEQEKAGIGIYGKNFDVTHLRNWAEALG